MSENEGYRCMFYSDLECPVQGRLKEFSFIDGIKPVKEDVEARMAQAMKSVMTASTFLLQCLASFCSSCPHLRRKTFEDATGSPLKAVPFQGEKKIE